MTKRQNGNKENAVENAAMRLSFPNQSRSFDDDNNRICFWGYDQTIEVTFYVKIDALKRLSKKMIETEAGCLHAFDTIRGKIEKVANNIYEHDKKGAFSYILSAEEF